MVWESSNMPYMTIYPVKSNYKLKYKSVISINLHKWHLNNVIWHVVYQRVATVNAWIDGPSWHNFNSRPLHFASWPWKAYTLSLVVFSFVYYGARKILPKNILVLTYTLMLTASFEVDNHLRERERALDVAPLPKITPDLVPY